MKYVCNDIVKPLKVKILHYAKRICEMYDLAKYLTPASIKGESKMASNWSVRNKEFTSSDLRLVIKDRVPKTIRGELDDRPEDCCSLTYEDWCELLSTIDVKDKIKRAAGHIKNITSAREASLSNSDKFVRIPRSKEANNGVSNSHKSPRRAHDRDHGAQRYCVLFKKARIPECK